LRGGSLTRISSRSSVTARVVSVAEAIVRVEGGRQIIWCSGVGVRVLVEYLGKDWLVGLSARVEVKQR
jgi:hypothetical protein